MPSCLLYFKKEKKFLRWSTVGDAPTTYLMSIKDLLRYYRYWDGQNGIDKLKTYIKQVVKTGTSWPGQSISDVVSHNKAGENEEHLSLEQILEEYDP